MKSVKKIYQFTLVLKQVDERTENLEDSLYEAGCDDALINFRNGTVYLDFDRQAASLEEAVLSAIKNVESSSVGAVVASVAPEDFVTESDIAKRLEIGRQAVSLWIKGERRKIMPFPKPVMKLSEKSPFWKWREVIEWLYNNQLVKDKEAVENALFLETVNVILDERDLHNRKYRDSLLKKFDKLHIRNQNI